MSNNYYTETIAKLKKRCHPGPRLRGDKLQRVSRTIQIKGAPFHHPPSVWAKDAFE